MKNRVLKLDFIPKKMKETNNEKALAHVFCIKRRPLAVFFFFTARFPFLSLSLSLWEIVAVYGGKLTKVVRLCPGLLSLLMEEGRKGGRDGGEIWGRGQTQSL